MRSIAQFMVGSTVIFGLVRSGNMRRFASSVSLFAAFGVAFAGPDLVALSAKPFKTIERQLRFKAGKPKDLGFGPLYTGSFKFAGAPRAQYWVVVAKGKTTSAKFGLYSPKNLGQKGFLALAGIKPAGWVPTEPDSIWLKNPKYPHVYLKFNEKPGEFINFETDSSGLKWGIEIARDPYYK